MNTAYNDVAAIEAYLDGTLEGEAEENFQLWRKEDPESEEKIEAQKALRKGMKVLFLQEYKEKLKKWEKKDIESKPKQIGNPGKKVDNPSVGRFSWLPSVAAAAIVVFVLLVGIWYGTATHSDEVIATNHYVLPPKPGENVRGSSHIVGGLDLADCNALRTQRGARQQIKPADEFYSLIKFYDGHCLFRDAEFLAAANAFAQVLEHDPQFKHKANAHWTMILALLASGTLEDEKLSQLIDQLPEGPDERLKNHAVHLKAELNSMWR